MPRIGKKKLVSPWKKKQELLVFALDLGCDGFPNLVSRAKSSPNRAQRSTFFVIALCVLISFHSLFYIKYFGKTLPAFHLSGKEFQAFQLNKKNFFLQDPPPWSRAIAVPGGGHEKTVV